MVAPRREAKLRSASVFDRLLVSKIYKLYHKVTFRLRPTTSVAILTKLPWKHGQENGQAWGDSFTN